MSNPSSDRRKLHTEVLALRRMFAQSARLEEIAAAAASLPSAVRRPLPIPNPAVAVGIPFSHVDTFQFRDGLFHIHGWALVPEWDPRATSAWLRVEDSQTWLTSLARERRPDVAASLADHPAIAGQPAAMHLADCGFRAVIDPNGTGWMQENSRVWICLLNGASAAAVRIEQPETAPAHP